MPDEENNVLAAAHITKVLDKAVVIAADQSPCPYCKRASGLKQVQ